ncbi:GNAT family N-acetyltransferase [Streptomyces flavofungini]|uniref:GNAT family N-acetyltransferase n=1 Tax=Streptomyces flavofungini TaxID=68200 RepID=UPI0034DF64AF
MNSDIAVLDNPVAESLRGPHAQLGRCVGRAATYLPGVSTFCALPAEPGAQDWSDLAELLGSGGFADMFSNPALPPPGWEPVFKLEGHQMLWPDGRTAGDPLRAAGTAISGTAVAGSATVGPTAADFAVVELGPDDVPEMLDLVKVAQPGPFGPRTCELGTYLGVRARGRLVAMAGERLRPPGFTEISAVCTAPEARGQGHAARLVRALVELIVSRGERPFLHVAEANTGAVALYERIGFGTRRNVTFQGFRTP